MPVLYAYLNIYCRNQYNLDYLASILSGLEKELEMLKAPIRNPILPAGLENRDQCCFVNVVIQCLFALYPFKSLLLTFVMPCYLDCTALQKPTIM